MKRTKKAKHPKTTMTVRVSLDVKEEIASHAAIEGRTPSNLVAFLLTQWAEAKKGKNLNVESKQILPNITLTEQK